jgi:hypothetical protein
MEQAVSPMPRTPELEAEEIFDTLEFDRVLHAWMGRFTLGSLSGFFTARLSRLAVSSFGLTE